MRVLWEIEGQHERFSPRVLDFDTTAVQRGLGDETDLGIEFTKLHVLVIFHCEFSNPTTSAVRMEQSWALRAEIRLGARRYDETKNGALLVAEEITVNNPLCVHSVAGKFFGGDSRARILLHEVRVLIRFEVECVDEEFPVFVLGLRIVHFPARVKRIGCSDPSVKCQVLGQEMLVHRDVQLVRAKVGR